MFQKIVGAIWNAMQLEEDDVELSVHYLNIEDMMCEVWEVHNENLKNTEEPHGVGG